METGTKKTIGKWFILVLINSILSFIFGLGFIPSSGHKLSFIGGMITGILTFVAIYTYIEMKAKNNNNYLFLKSIEISAVIKACLQLLIFISPFMAIEFWAGAVAVDILKLSLFTTVSTEGITASLNFGQAVQSFLTSFSATLITGVGLSISVLIISAPVSACLSYKQNHMSDNNK